jgi:hypothetical protein
MKKSDIFPFFSLSIFPYRGDKVKRSIAPGMPKRHKRQRKGANLQRQGGYDRITASGFSAKAAPYKTGQAESRKGV